MCATTFDAVYKKHRLVVRQYSYGKPSSKLPGWYTGYVELLSDEWQFLGEPQTPEELETTQYFNEFYGGITFYDHLFVGNANKFVGFDTAHFGMQSIATKDCIKVLEKTADKLSKIMSSDDVINKIMSHFKKEL